MTATALTRARRRTTPFWPEFFRAHRDFWPIARAASVFEASGDWPAVDDYVRAFEVAPPVRFVPTAPRPRRARRTALDLDSMYDAQIVRGQVPTRERCWHDFSNALVWASFPKAKQALHARQHRAIMAWIPEGAQRLPGARSREMDALALFDEGGVVQIGARAVVFGHALYEGAVLLHSAGEAAADGPRRVIARQVLELPAAETDESEASLLRRVDDALTQRLQDAALTPESFPRARPVFV